MICYNGNFQKEINLDITKNRGFLYGDGFFETMLFTQGEVRFLENHLDRICNSMVEFGFDLNTELFKLNIKNSLYSLIQHYYDSTKDYRIKLTVWRNPGGLYTPENNHFSYFIEPKLHSLLSDYREIEDLGILTEGFFLPQTIASNHKTINSINYIQASRIKKNLKVDELILLNSNNKICEATCANIFWEKEGIFFTPSLSTGCIAGVRRQNFIQQLITEKRVIKEGEYTLEEALAADKYILTNALSIRVAKKIQEKSLPHLK